LLSATNAKSSLTQLPWGNEIQNLHPTLVDAIDFDRDLLANLGDVFQVLGQRQMESMPCALLPTRENPSLLQNDTPPARFHRMKLSKVEHHSVLQLARQHGVTISAIFYAITTLISLKHQVSDNPKSIWCWYTIADQRNRVREDLQPYYGLALNSENMSIPVSDTLKSALAGMKGKSVLEEFWQVCKTIKEKLAFIKVSNTFPTQ